MTWDAYNRRKSALRGVLQLADRRREDTADELLDATPGARALLDAHRDRPELAKAFAKEQALLAVSAGVSSWHPDLLGQGERIVAEARDRAVHAPVDTLPSRDGEGRASAFIARLRNALAA